MSNIKFGAIESTVFHYSSDTARLSPYFVEVNQFTYSFQNYFHPFLAELIQKLNQTSIAGMLDPVFLKSLRKTFFKNDYTPLNSSSVQVESFDKIIDLSPGGPYSIYNWELGYHIPMLVTRHLLSRQRFPEALKWLNLVFDPACTDTSIPVPQRYWKFFGFFESQDPCGARNIDALLELLSTPDAELTTEEIQCKQSVHDGYQAVYDYPFQPHVVARTRPYAYQLYAVMTWLDIYLAWGDTLFQQGTMQGSVELINEATLCYVLMANFLGPKPQQLPPLGTTSPKNFLQLKSAGLDAMGNAMVDLESQFPFNVSGSSGSANQAGPLFGVMRTMYFCIPPNPQLLGYWDLVADRLFKIRHCMDITGVVRPLPLFEPPIDPGMLVKAAAAGLDIGSIVSGMSQPFGPARSLTLIQKALEIAGEVRSLGANLLSALEKEDAEQLALLHQEHEIAVQSALQNVRFLQWKQIQEATNGLLRSRTTVLERFKYYLRLLNLAPDPKTTPDTFSLDPAPELTEDNFEQVFDALVTSFDKQIDPLTYPDLQLAGGGSPKVASGSSSISQLYLIQEEDAELNSNLPTARDFRIAVNIANAIATGLNPIPSAEAHLAFWGIGVHSRLLSGDVLAAAARIGGDMLGIRAGHEQDQAGISARKGGHIRRTDEWVYQANLASRELMQLGRQILGSLIAEQVALHDYKMATFQVAQSQEVATFLQGQQQTTRAGTLYPGKVTTADFYAWMQGRISNLFYQYYRLAVDTARKAERTMKRELMRPELDSTDFVQFNYWDAGHQGLFSGEALFLDVKRMEMAYHDNNKRELELTHAISLRLLDPLALLSLKITGTCSVTIPEWFFTMRCPSHYLVRIKSVAVSIPSVTGPYTSLNCSLTQQKSTIRILPSLKNGQYARDESNPDERFVDYFGSTDEFVTSTGNNDAGMFDNKLADDRFLPFEGTGGISVWTLSLTNPYALFDYSTITDVVLHLRCTARNGGGLLEKQAKAELKNVLSTKSVLPLFFSLRHDLQVEWAAFEAGGPNFAFGLRREDFPFMTQGHKVAVDQIVLYAASGQTIAQRTVVDPLNWSKVAADLNGATGLSNLSFPSDASVLTTTAEDVYLVIAYHLTS